MPDIVRSITEIENKIKELGNETKEAESKVRVLKSGLKLDDDLSKRVKTYTDFQKALTNQLALQQQRYDNVREALERYQKLIDENTSDAEQNEKAKARLVRQEEKLAIAINKTKTELLVTGHAIEDYNDEIDKSKNKMAEYAVAFGNLHKAVFRVASLLLSTTVQQAQSIKQIDILAERYNTTISTIAKNQYILEVVTDNTRAYEEALKGVTTGLSDIAEGRGVAYLNALKQIGISKEEITSAKSVADAYELIVDRLRTVDDATQRAALATALFGQEAGLSLLQIFNLTDEQVTEYEKDAERYAARLEEYRELLVDLNYDQKEFNLMLDEFKLLLAVGVAPTLEIILGLVKNFLDFINSLPEGVREVITTTVSWGIIVLLLATSLGKTVTALKNASVAFNILKAVMKSTWATAAIGLGLIGLLTAGLWKLGISASEARGEIERVDDAVKEMEDLFGQSNANMTSTTSSTVQSYKTRTFNMQVDIYGHGDTTVSDETGEKIAQLTAEEINEQLGKELSTK